MRFFPLMLLLAACAPAPKSLPDPERLTGEALARRAMLNTFTEAGGERKISFNDDGSVLARSHPDDQPRQGRWLVSQEDELCWEVEGAPMECYQVFAVGEWRMLLRSADGRERPYRLTKGKTT